MADPRYTEAATVDPRPHHRKTAGPDLRHPGMGVDPRPGADLRRKADAKADLHNSNAEADLRRRHKTADLRHTMAAAAGRRPRRRMTVGLDPHHPDTGADPRLADGRRHTKASSHRADHRRRPDTKAGLHRDPRHPDTEAGRHTADASCTDDRPRPDPPAEVARRAKDGHHTSAPRPPVTHPLTALPPAGTPAGRAHPTLHPGRKAAAQTVARIAASLCVLLPLPDHSVRGHPPLEPHTTKLPLYARAPYARPAISPRLLPPPSQNPVASYRSASGPKTPSVTRPPESACPTRATSPAEPKSHNSGRRASQIPGPGR